MNDPADNAYNEGYRAGHKNGYLACIQAVKKRLDYLLDLFDCAADVNGPESPKAQAIRGAILATRTAFSDLGFPSLFDSLSYDCEITFEAGVGEFASDVQKYADRGYTWGTALQLALIERGEA